MAHRLVERGVRLMHVYCNAAWDAYDDVLIIQADMEAQTNKATAALLRYLSQTDLLDDVRVVWGGEFGRMPVCEIGTGRDHNPHGFPTWMAGVGVKGSCRFRLTDVAGEVVQPFLG